jgi:hypothetical protein
MPLQFLVLNSQVKVRFRICTFELNLLDTQIQIEMLLGVNAFGIPHLAVVMKDHG